MAENEAPEKIYLERVLCSNEVYDTWKSQKTISDDIEYTRTDVFIEKACDAYCKVCGHYPHTTPDHICRQACNYYKDFRAYIKGE